VFNSPGGGVPLDDLREIFSGCQWMAKVPDAIEMLPKVWTAWVGLSPPPLSQGAQNWWLVTIAWICSAACRSPICNFLLRKLSHEFIVRGMSILHEFQTVIFPYCFWMVSHGWASCYSPTYAVHVGMILTQSSVKVKVSGLLKFRHVTSNFAKYRYYTKFRGP